MESDPITSGQTDWRRGKKTKTKNKNKQKKQPETVIDFIFLGSKITVDGDRTMKLKETCSLEEKLLKSRDITLLKKVTLSKL